MLGEFAAMTEALESSKVNAAHAAADLVKHGMIAGLGSGTTAALMVRRLGERVEREGLKIVAVATSVATADLAGELKIPLRELDDVGKLDINLDGADEIDPQFRMIKGRGGALLREKIVATAALHRVTMITADKRVDRLGTNMPIPVEVSPIGVKHTERLAPSAWARRRRSASVPTGLRYLTDGGNKIIDCRFAADRRPQRPRSPAPVHRRRSRNRAVSRPVRHLDRRLGDRSRAGVDEAAHVKPAD